MIEKCWVLFINNETKPIGLLNCVIEMKCKEKIYILRNQIENIYMNNKSEPSNETKIAQQFNEHRMTYSNFNGICECFAFG